MIKISIVVPIYNGEKYLKRCIDSIRTQTFKNWELVLIDDGSDDLSGEICDDYANLDSRIKVSHVINRGVSVARNTGINLSKGDFITFIDCDDWIEKDFLEKSVDAINRMKVDLLITSFVFDNNKGHIKNIFKGKKEEIFSRENIQKEFFRQNKFAWTVYDKFFKTEIIKKYMFNSKVKIGEDMLFCWQIFKSVKRIGYLPLYKYHYDISASSTMTSDFSLKWFDGIKVKKKIYKEVKNFSKEIELLARITCIVDMIILSKKAIHSNSYNTKRLILLLQKIIRKNMYIIFLYPTDNIISIRHRLGILYFSLPYKWCKLISKFI